MAITLQITDGTDTVDFNDGSNLALAEAFQMNVGDGSVSELLIAGWYPDVDTDAKAVITKTFNRLIRKSINHYSEQRIDRAVWLVWKPEDQTDTQYAKVMGGGEVEVVNHTVGGLRGGRFAPSVIREGEWRSVAPDGTAGVNISSGTIQNKSDTDGNNWVDIANTRTNDAPGHPKFIVYAGDMGTIPDRMVIATKRGDDTTFLNKFNPHFNPTDLANNGGGSQVADTSAPGDFRLELTADGTPYWTIADTDLIAYHGNYNVYVVAYFGAGSGTGRIRFETDYEAGEYKELSSSAVQNLIYLGNFNIPGTQFNPFVTINTSSDLQLKLGYDELTGTGTVYIKGMFLIPQDVPVYEVQFSNASTDGIVVDTLNKLSYVVDSSANQKIATSAATQTTVKGRYPVAHGGDTNRYFFYFWGNPSSGYLTNYTHNNNCIVTLTTVDRFLGLRGNT